MDIVVCVCGTMPIIKTDSPLVERIIAYADECDLSIERRIGNAIEANGKWFAAYYGEDLVTCK